MVLKHTALWEGFDFQVVVKMWIAAPHSICLLLKVVVGMGVMG